MREIRDEFGVELPELDLGGGLGVAYVPTTTRRRSSPSRLSCARSSNANAISPGYAGRGSVSNRAGRSAGRRTLTLYEVGTVKPVEVGADVVRTYVSVDGGMSDNVRTALYDASYTCTLANRVSNAPPDAEPGGRQALRVGRHRGARRGAARRRRAW